MSDRNLQALYQTMILDHNRRPKNYYKPASYTHTCEGFNPLCGDHLHIFINLSSSKIQECSFEGTGCAICKASASMMTVAVTEKSKEEASKIASAFLSMLQGHKADSEVLGKLSIFEGVFQYPARVKCAALAWHALAGSLSSQALCVSSENMIPENRETSQ